MILPSRCLKFYKWVVRVRVNMSQEMRAIVNNNKNNFFFYKHQAAATAPLNTKLNKYKE